MDKYIVAPPSGSTNNSVGAEDRPWKEGHFDSVKLNGGDVGTYLAESTGYGIVSGCEPSISGLTVTVGAGVVHLADGTRKELSATSITLDAADSTNPRIDLVYIDSTGEVAKVTGTAAASPSAPALPSGGISVAQVSVAAGATTGTATDSRDYINVGIVKKESDFTKFINCKKIILDNDITINSALPYSEGGQIIDLNGHTITLSDDYSDEYIWPVGIGRNYSYQHIFKNGTIDCNHVDCSVFLIDNAWNLTAYSLNIRNNTRGLCDYVSAQTLQGSFGAEALFKDISLYHSEQDFNARKGLDIRMGDSYFENIIPVGYSTGVYVNGTDNVLVGIHPWGYPLLDSNPYPTSRIMNIGFEIFYSGTRLIGCTADTFEPIDKDQAASYANGGIGFYVCTSMVENICPRAMTHKSTNNSNHVDFYFSDTTPSGTPNVLGYCSLITPTTTHPSGQLGQNFKGINVHMDKPYVYVSGADFELPNIINDVFTAKAGFEIIHGDVRLIGNCIVGNVVIHATSGTFSTSAQKVLDVSSKYKLINAAYGMCGLSQYDWSVNHVGYFYMANEVAIDPSDAAAATTSYCHISLNCPIRMHN